MSLSDQTYLNDNIEYWVKNGPPNENNMSRSEYQSEIIKYDNIIKIILKLTEQYPEIKNKLYSLHESYAKYKHPTKLLHDNGIIFN